MRTIHFSINTIDKFSACHSDRLPQVRILFACPEDIEQNELRFGGARKVKICPLPSAYGFSDLDDSLVVANERAKYWK